MQKALSGLSEDMIAVALTCQAMHLIHCVPKRSCTE